MKVLNVLNNTSLSSIFSIIGIVVTVYYSAYQLPRLQKEAEITKVENINDELIQGIQEIVFAGSKLSHEDVSKMIKGKELKYNVFYPRSENDLLIQSQTEVLTYTFIPQADRQKIYDKISSIITELPPDKIEGPENKEEKFNLFNWVTRIISLLIGVIGSVSVYYTSKKLNKENEDEIVEEYKEAVESKVKRAVSVEQQIFTILKSLKDNYEVQINNESDRPDFILKTNGQSKIAIEVKYTETDLIPLRTMSNVIKLGLTVQLPLILISNAEITAKSKSRMEAFNERNPENKVYFINMSSSKEIQSKLESILNEI